MDKRMVLPLLVVLTVGLFILGGAYAKWSRPAIDLLTDNERQWLAGDGDGLRLGVDLAFPSAVFKGSRLSIVPRESDFPTDLAENNDNYSLYGLAAEYLRKIEDQLGIAFNFKYIKIEADEIFKAMMLGEVDAIFTTHVKGLNRNILLTDPIIEFPAVIIARLDAGITNLESLHGRIVALVRSSPESIYALPKLNGKATWIYFHTLREALRAVSMGRAEAVIAGLDPAAFHIQKDAISNLTVAGELDYSVQFCVGVRPACAPLVGIINKGLSDIPLSAKKMMAHRWLNLGYHAERQKTLVFIGLMVLALLAAILFLVWVRVLKYQVKRKTLDLSRQLVKLEAAEKELREAQECFAAFMEQIPGGAWIKNPAGDVMWVNSWARDHLGAENWTGTSIDSYLGRPVDNTLGPKEAPARITGSTLVSRRLKTRNGQLREHQIVHFPIVVAGEIGLSGVLAFDVEDFLASERERKKLENVLLQTQKMEALGTFAGGIAHDFNNILWPIYGYAEIITEINPEGGETWNHAQEILQGARRAAGLVRQILAFSRKKKDERVLLDPRLITKEVLKLMRASMPSDIEIHQNIPINELFVMADPGQIYQAVMNLCANSQHAMKGKPGQLTVSIDTVSIADQGALLPGRSDILPGRYMMLSVADNGCGIPDEIRERIFDPYFTTKNQGEGTGLGLAMVLGIVKQHGGHIDVQSIVGKGTRFDIYLPLAEGQAVAPSGQSTAGARSYGRQELILVVDDERAITQMMSKLLESSGYRVITTNQGVEALRIVMENRDAIQMVITDQTMPIMSGLQMAEYVNNVLPGVPIIIATGADAAVVQKKAAAAGIRRVIQKPVNRQTLLTVVREVFEEVRQAA